MYFTTLTEISNILFFGWNTDSWSDVFIGFIIICILTIFFEALKAAKSSLVFYNRRPLTSPDQRTHHEEEHEATSSQADLLSSLRIPVGSQHSQIRKFFLFLVESGLHMFNFLYGYILMLLVMTFSIWFLLAILLVFFLSYRKTRTCRTQPIFKSTDKKKVKPVKLDVSG